MSAEAAALVRTWAVGDRTVTLTVPRSRKGQIGTAAIEWTPDVPARMSGEEWRQYREGRNRALADLADELGISVAVLEV